MYSEHSLLPPKASRHRTRALGLLATLLLGAACGKMGDPLPPLRTVPIRTSDLQVTQQGRQLLFDMAYPTTTAGGMALGGIQSLELMELVRPALEEGELPAVDPADFSRSAQKRMTLSGTELGASVSGSRIQIRLPLADALPEVPEAHFYAVRTARGIEVSDLSNRVGLVLREPPAAPSELAAMATARGIELSWASGEDPEIGFDIYRRPATSRSYDGVLRRVKGEQRKFLDTSASYGQRYIYTVRSVATAKPPVRSAEAGEREVRYEDTFAPPLPESFVALGERESVRLRWDASDADDVRGYILYRREPGREFHRLNEEPIAALEYLDRGKVTGLSYAYRIQVIDEAGNESPLSNPVSTSVR